MDSSTATVITMAVAPIVMVSATGLLFIGVQTKNLHLADRVRDLMREYRSAAAPHHEQRRQAIRAQLTLFERRLRLSQHALESLYGAIAGFVMTGLLLAATSWLGNMVALVAGGVFVLGIAFVLLALILEFLEMRAGLHTIAIEMNGVSNTPSGFSG